MDSVSAVICWSDKILLFHRDNISTIPNPDCWELPGGGIEEGETPLEGIKRELEEEVSHVPKNIQYLTEVKNEPGYKVFVYICFIDDNEAKMFKLGEDEGQEIAFFTIEDALRLKLTPTLKKYLTIFKSDIAEMMAIKKLDKLKYSVERQILI